jgi:hypothetical protein
VNVSALEPDAPLDTPPRVTAPPQHGFGRILDAAGAALDRADRAERAFAEHRGGLAEMIVERASADVMLQLAATAAARATQAVSTLLGMQV